MGPLSAKQHREYLKFSAQEARETAKMEREEARKQQLHEIKLVEAAGKAGQTLGHKEEVHKYKMGTLGAPLKPKTPNPLAGAEIFKRGQHMLPYQVEDAAKARKTAKQNTDTVPAMLTPGEAVIPEPAAQNPKNKPIIKRMVQEGRKANKTKKGFLGFRDGSINIANSDVIPSRVQQAAGYNEGTIQVPVPSLAYEHSDVPGSSFEDGTERVYDFNRGSSASYHYEDGVEDVPEPRPILEPTVVASPVVHYQNVIPENLIKIPTTEEKIENAVPRSAYPDVTADIKLKDVQAMINGSVSSEFDIKERPFKNVGMEVIEPLPMLAAKPKVVVEGKDRFPVPSPIVAKSVGGNNSTIDMPVEPVAFIPDPNAKQASDAEMQAVIDVNEGKIVPSLKPEDDDTRPEYWIKHLRGSQKDVDKAMANKDDESAINSLKDLFTYKGIKSVLGLNDQEVARLAVATVGGRALGYSTARALSYGGRQAFETSLRRQAQEEANKRQDKQLAAQAEREDMRTAITLAGQAKADKKAEADRKLTEKRLSLQERKEEAIQAAREADRRFEILKEDNRWNHTQSKDARAEQQHLNDKLQQYLAMDVPPAVRSKGLSMAFAEAKTPQDWLNNMRNATTYLAANVQHYPPGYGRKGGSGGDDDGEGSGKGKYPKKPDMMIVNGELMPVQYHKGQYQTMDGRTIPFNAVKTIEAHRYEEDTVTKKVEALIPEGAKDKDGKPINAKAIANNSNRILASIPGGLTIDNKADVMNLSIPQLVESGVQDPKAIRQVIRGNIAKTSSPSDSNLWKPNGKSLSAQSMTEFTGALDTVINNAASRNQVIDDQTAYEALKRQFNSIPADVRAKMEKSNLTQKGYSTFQDWAISTTTGNPNKWKAYTEPKTK